MRAKSPCPRRSRRRRARGRAELDLKQTPLYEDNELAFFKTHYYGGIKKYQWTAIPLELHGVVATKDGEVIEVVIAARRMTRSSSSATCCPTWLPTR